MECGDDMVRDCRETEIGDGACVPDAGTQSLALLGCVDRLSTMTGSVETIDTIDGSSSCVSENDRDDHDHGDDDYGDDGDGRAEWRTGWLPLGVSDGRDVLAVPVHHVRQRVRPATTADVPDGVRVLGR